MNSRARKSSNSGWLGGRAHLAEIVGRGHQARAEMPLPDAVDHHPRRTSGCSAASATGPTPCGSPTGRQRGHDSPSPRAKHRRQAGLHAAFRAVELAAIEHVDRGHQLTAARAPGPWPWGSPSVRRSGRSATMRPVRAARARPRRSHEKPVAASCCSSSASACRPATRLFEHAVRPPRFVHGQNRG